MSLEYFADLTGISSKTCNRYNIILEKNHLLFVYRSNDKMKNFDGTMRQINNCYSRYCDKELCIAYATDYENRYGYEHKIVQTRKNKEEADKNRMFVKSVVQRSRKKLEMKMTIKKAWNFILRMIPCISIENTRKSTETGH